MSNLFQLEFFSTFTKDIDEWTVKWKMNKCVLLILMELKNYCLHLSSSLSLSIRTFTNSRDQRTARWEFNFIITFFFNKYFNIKKKCLCFYHLKKKRHKSKSMNFAKATFDHKSIFGYLKSAFTSSFYLGCKNVS